MFSFSLPHLNDQLSDRLGIDITIVGLESVGPGEEIVAIPLWQRQHALL
jgi:hypothetical protein